MHVTLCLLLELQRLNLLHGDDQADFTVSDIA